MRPPRIEDHAAIGDGRSVALVTTGGAIDWMCWPRVDSPAWFGALLDPRAGAWTIRPLAPHLVSRAYVPGTNVLETTFDVGGGSLLVVTDLMTVSSEEDKQHAMVPDHEILRVVRCERGAVLVEHDFAPRPGFSARPVLLHHAGMLGVRCEVGSELATLRSDHPIALLAPDVAGSRFVLKAGESVTFSLTYSAGEPAILPPLGDDADRRIATSIAWWRDWIARSTYDGPYRDAVERSLLVLKLLAFAPSGAIVAAPTTSLPERVGGDLNWDYRFCWLRDASFTIRALHGVGYHDDARAFAEWLLHSTRLTRPALGVLYDVYGNAPTREQTLPHLAGYAASTPVRVRNAAADQLQLDCYGEVVDAAIQSLHAGPVDLETQRMLADFGRFVCEHWRRPDHGIWEDRGRPRHYTYSKAMCWVALDRLLRLHANGRAPDIDVRELASHRDAIRDDVMANGYDRTRGIYTVAYDSCDVDASLLLLGWYGFDDPGSPRMRRTVAAYHERLCAAPGLYHRNLDSMRRGEGAFGICSFWVADLLARGASTVDEARDVLDAALACTNDVGLFGEEIDPRTGGALGNFPQAYTHVGLINAVLSVAAHDRRATAATWRKVAPSRDGPCVEVRR